MFRFRWKLAASSTAFHRHHSTAAVNRKVFSRSVSFFSTAHWTSQVSPMGTKKVNWTDRPSLAVSKTV